jgi:hypothetical protein
MEFRLLGPLDVVEHGGSVALGGVKQRSLLAQRQAGVVAEPLLASPERSGVMALAEGAGLLVVDLSERWREEGARPGGLAPADPRTHFGWSLTAGAS